MLFKRVKKQYSYELLTNIIISVPLLTTFSSVSFFFPDININAFLIMSHSKYWWHWIRPIIISEKKPIWWVDQIHPNIGVFIKSKVDLLLCLNLKYQREFSLINI